MATLNHGTHALDGVVYHATSEEWAGWTRQGCSYDGCDYAVYTAPDRKVYDGYIPTEDHPANCATPDDVTRRPYTDLPATAPKTKKAGL